MRFLANNKMKPQLLGEWMVYVIYVIYMLLGLLQYILHLETACDPLLLVGHQHARQKKEVSLV